MSTEEDDRPTIQERYQHATQSSQLRAQAEHRGDIDYIIGAGFLGDPLGAVLLRLRGEYDTRRAEIRAADDRLPAWTHRAAELRRRAKAWRVPMLPAPDAFLLEAARLEREAAAMLLTQRALTLSNLKSLVAARDALRAFAAVLRADMAPHLTDAALHSIADQVLDVWLDPLCHNCQGRGFNGGTHRGEQRVICRPCRGSRFRRAWIGEKPSERRLAAGMLAEIEARTTAAGRTLAKLLAQREIPNP